MRRWVILLLSVMLVGCGKKEEEPIETTAPPPPPTAAHVEDTSVVFDRWGDENLNFSIQGEEAIQSYTDVQVKVLPNVNQFDCVQIDYVQGVALNDFGKAYWAGYPDDTKSEYDEGFTTDTECFRFVRTEKNSTFIISGPAHLSSLVESVYERLGGGYTEESLPEENVEAPENGGAE